MRTIGDRLNIFDNNQDQSVRTFNILFTEVPLTGFNETDIVSIGELTINATTRILLINNIVTEHSFVRRLSSENDYIDDLATDTDEPNCVFYDFI